MSATTYGRDVIETRYGKDGTTPVPGGLVRSGDRYRKYLPTLSDLVDRLSICQLKAIFIPEHKEAYRKEIDLILHDINLILDERAAANDFRLDASAIHACMVMMLTNRYIWENETKARQGGAEQDKLLKLTHSVNGIRNSAKNILSNKAGERLDFKIDCFAAELIQQFGDWNIFGEPT